MSSAGPHAPFYHLPSTFDSGLDISEPFGYSTQLNTSERAQRAPSALPDSHLTFVRGSVSPNDTLEVPKYASSPKIPVYFNSLGANVGLVCGRENQTKYHVLKNLLAASWKDREPHPGRDTLCFTAENGSLEITQTIAGLLQKGESGEREVEVIVLTWPSNLSNLRALHASSKNVKVHPLLVHPEDVKLEHLRHIYEGRIWGSQNAVFDDLLQGSRARGTQVELEEVTLASLREKLNSNIPPWLRSSIGGQVYPGAFFFLDMNPHLSQQLDDARSDSRASPAWMEWILQGQPRSSGVPTLQGDYSPKTPLLLCVDWTGCTPEERRVQNVLADIVLRHWVGYRQAKPQEREQGTTLDRGTIVCDNVQHYLSSEDQNPFTRSLSRLSYESTLSSSNAFTDSNATAAPQLTNGPIPAFPIGPQSHSHGITKFTSHNLLLLTESPITIPATLQDTSNFLVLHRFTSPGWLAALEEHFHLQTPSAPSHPFTKSVSSSSSPSSPSLLDQILDLDDKHVLLFAPPKSAFTLATPSRTSMSGSGSGYGSSHSSHAAGATGTTNGTGNINGVIQRPKKQFPPTPVPVGRHLTKICLSKEDHVHPENAERNVNVNDVGVDASGGGRGGQDDSEGGAPNFGVIGGNVRRNANGSDPARVIQPGVPSLSPYHIGGAGGANGFSPSRPQRLAASGMLIPQRRGGDGGLTSSPSSSVMRERSPHHHQLTGSHSPAVNWPTREENHNGFPFGSATSTNSFASPSITAVNGYLDQQRSPSTSPFIPINSDAVISRPMGTGMGGGGGGGMGMGMGVPRRISPPSSSSASGMSFSYSNGNVITPSSSAANPSSISTSFGMSPTSPVGAGFTGRATAFSPFTTSSMLKTDQADFSLGHGRGGLTGTRSSYATSEAASRYFVGPERTPQVMSFSNSHRSRPSPQPSTEMERERHARTDTTSTTGSRDDTSSADYVEVSPGSDFSRVVGSPVPRDRAGMDLTGQKTENGESKRSYAGVAAPAREGLTSSRRDTVVPPPGKDMTVPTLGTLRVSPMPLICAITQPTHPQPPLQTSQHSTTPPSSTDLQSPSPSSEPPPPPPVYPDSFFWPLLDALEKSRAQVSTPHNRAQSVRHSVVGQELPPSARARLGLTFKEYVAAAARQGVVVTGDSGDKAWIAMREWKYPGKSYGAWPVNR